MLRRLPVPRISPDRLEALRETIDDFDPRMVQRGAAYLRERRVRGLRATADRIEADVVGTDTYRTLWWWTGREWEHECGCPVGVECKHAWAVAAAALGEHGDADDEDDDTPGDDADAGEADAAMSEADGLAALRGGGALWERQAGLDALLVGAPDASLTPYGPPLEDLLREPDPDTRCWRLADAIAAAAGGWLPEPLRPYLTRGDVAGRYQDRERAATAAALLDWARQRGAHPPRRLRIVCGLQARAEGDAALVFEVRLTTPRLHDAPRTLGQLHGLDTECQRDPGLFAPEQASLLSWLRDHAQPAGGEWNATRLRVARPAALLARLVDAGLGEWGEPLDAALAERAGVAEGVPVRLGAVEVRLVPSCVATGDEVLLDLRARWPDGRERPLPEVVYVAGEPGTVRGALLLSDGVVFTVQDEPPLPLRQRFLRQGGLPLPPGERAPLVGALAEAFPHLRATLAAHTRVHAVAPSVLVDLRADDWLTLRLLARGGRAPWHPTLPADDPAPLFEFTPERGWVRIRDAAAGRDLHALAGTAAPPAGDAAAAPEPSPAAAPSAGAGGAAGEAWIEEPDPATVAPVTAWLLALPLAGAARAGADDGRAPGWWARAARRTLELLADLWEQRPPGVAYYGTPRVRRLLGMTRAGAPRLRVRTSGVDWLRISAEWEAEGLQLGEADLAALRAATGRFVKLDAGWVRRDLVEEHDEAAALLADFGIALDGGEQQLSVWQLAGASPEGLAHLARLGVDAETLAAAEALRERIEQFAGVPSVPLPDGLTATLRPYQRQGLDFLAHTAALGLGAVLADDMGLGKTVQALAWLLHLQASDPDGGPSLVVCPASVVHNWAREAERFAPGLRRLLLTSGKERHTLREEIPDHDLVITTYALLRRDVEQWRRVKLRAAVLDEAQFIKNPDAAVARAALALDARHRLALTGTPLENRALDLWSIMQFLNPGYLGSRAAFVRHVDRPDAPPHTRALLAAKLRPVLLRRSKGAVAPELPPRIEERRDCELTTEQRHLYLAELKKSRSLLAQVDSPERFAQERLHILAALTRLRQICCHPALAGGRPELPSGKFDAFFELLEPLLAEGHKVLVFSQFVQLLKLLQGALRQRAIRFHTLTGSTARRDEVVTAFQEDPEPGVFLISLKAGGTGLNLTAASYVVLFDPWWNPAVEAQAIDRTHRIGQEQTVIAYRMLTRGTIEERIWELQQRKAALVRDVLGEGGFSRALTRDDLEYLLADVVG